LVASSDRAYKRTKLIKQGKKRIDKKFALLAEWISKMYGVKVLDIQEEFMTHNNKVRIAVHLETYQERIAFKKDNDWWSNFDPLKQHNIAEKYLEIGNVHKVPTHGVLGKLKKRNPTTTDIFVSFSAFEPIAREEANGLIPKHSIETLYKTLECPEIWTISRCFATVTLFVYQDEHKDKIKSSPEFKHIEDTYFKLLKEYDEFDYWKRENFGIGIDSKQNFDDNYESNWYYYYK